MGFCRVAMRLWARFQVEMLACRHCLDTGTSVLVDFERLGLLGSPPWILVVSLCVGFVCFVFASLLSLGLG